MTDQTIPADKVRAILDEWERIKEHADWDDIDHLVQDVRALLPTPPRPTLADMTEEERRACKLEQADVAGEAIRPVIVNPYWKDGIARVLWRGGFIEEIEWERITPRPDLPPLPWPGTEKPAPAPALPDGWRLADHPEYGRVIVTTENPDEYGLVAFVHRDDDLHRGHGSDWRDPAELTYIDQEDDQ